MHCANSSSDRYRQVVVVGITPAPEYLSPTPLGRGFLKQLKDEVSAGLTNDVKHTSFLPVLTALLGWDSAQVRNPLIQVLSDCGSPFGHRGGSEMAI